MLNIDNITVFALVLMRMSGCIFFNPIIGRRNFPNIFKVGFTILLTFIIMSFASPEVPPVSSPLEYIVRLFMEFIVGYAIGFIVTLFSYVIIFGGEISDMQMGLSMSKVYDPQSNVSMSISATFYNILFMFLFFAADGHLTLIRLFLVSGEFIPYGQVQISSVLASNVLDIFCQCTILAVKLSLPIIAIEILVEFGVGILMKAIPQINIFVVNIQAKLLIGILVMVFLFMPFAGFLERLITLLFQAIESVLNLI